MSPSQRKMLDGPRSTFQIGEALSKTFSVWGSNLIPFVLVTLIINAPTLYFMRRQFFAVEEKDVQLWGALGFLSGIVMGTLASGAVTFAVVQQLRGRPCGIGEALYVGAARLFPAIGVALLSGLAILGGFLLLVIPGIIVFLKLYVATPVAIMERPGVVASLKRSSALTTGVKGQLFVMSILIFVVAFVVGYAIEMGTGDSSPNTRWIVHGAFEVVVQSFGAVLPAVVYVLLRASRDGASIEDVAKVFD